MLQRLTRSAILSQHKANRTVSSGNARIEGESRFEILRGVLAISRNETNGSKVHEDDRVHRVDLTGMPKNREGLLWPTRLRERQPKRHEDAHVWRFRANRGLKEVDGLLSAPRLSEVGPE